MPRAPIGPQWPSRAPRAPKTKRAPGRSNATRRRPAPIRRQKSGPGTSARNAIAEHNRKTARNEHERRGPMSTAERGRNEHGRMSTAERNEHNLKGLQGNASIPMQGSHVTLTPEQRTRIREHRNRRAQCAAGRPCRLQCPRRDAWCHGGRFTSFRCRGRWWRSTQYGAAISISWLATRSSSSIREI